MKKYSLSISIPLKRSLSQEEALDRLLSDNRAYTYSRELKDPPGSHDYYEKYTITYNL